MTNPLGTADFFALEAADALDRIAVLAARESAPDADDLLRATRLFRGSALMAQQVPIARAAGELESSARAIRNGTVPWSAATREQLGSAVEEFRLLVRHASQWSDADTARVTRLAVTLAALSGSPSAVRIDAPPPPAGSLNAGVRAFVAREASVVAGALDRAGRALSSAPGDREPIYAVIRRMQSLRGLAELGDLAPLPELLDGVELALGDLTRSYAPPPGADEVMVAGAEALVRAARDVANDGRPDPEAAEARRFTELLVRAFAVERDVVPIESLYLRGDASPMSRPESQPQFAVPEPMGPLELVSHGEHLSQSADLIAQASSDVQRDLRLYRLVGTLRAAGAPAHDAVAGALVVFARSAREAMAAGVGASDTGGLVVLLRKAGELLRMAAEAPDRMLLSRRLLDVAHEVDQLRMPAASAESANPGDLTADRLSADGAEQEIVPIASLLYDGSPLAGDAEPAGIEAAGIEPAGIEPQDAEPGEADVIPIVQLAPDADGLPVVDIATLAPDESPGLLEAAYSRLRRLVGLERQEGASRSVAEVEIVSLSYRGQAALDRAGQVGQELSRALTGGADLEEIRPLLQELLDLVPLAQTGR